MKCRLPSLHALQIFLAIAQSNSFTKAGERMCLSQSAVSKQIKQLEAFLEAPLFVRRHQAIEMTPRAVALAASLTPIFSELEGAVRRAAARPARPPRPLLTVNAPPTFATRWLAPRLSDFARHHPGVDLVLTTDWPSSASQAHSADCMIAFGKPDWLQPQSLLIEVFTEQHVLVSSPRLWINGEPPTLASSTLLHVQDVALRLPIWSDWLQAWGPADLDLGPGLQLSTLDQAINAAVAGAGVGVVDLSMVRSELQSGALLRHGREQLSGRIAYWFVDLTKKADQSALVALFALWLQAQAKEHQQTCV